MTRLFKLRNTIQPYPWGSRTAIADLLGKPSPSGHPEAELWMGAHPKASSQVWFQGRWQSLHDLIRKDPLPLVGQTVLDLCGPQLPFLFKVLAVEQPLSIQAHPSKELAIEGFARENTEGIALSAPHRNYRDDQHKPECVCAITPFQALCGFRKPQDIFGLLGPVWPADQRGDLDGLKNSSGNGALRSFFVNLMTLEKNRRVDLVQEVVAASKAIVKKHIVYRWIVTLNDAFPEDVGVLSPALLHLIELQPGQALFLPAGRPHAYLQGVAIELMANSDNVLRGGLTSKHIDTAELLRVLDFSPSPLQVLEPQAAGALELIYTSQADEFQLSVLNPQIDHIFDSGRRPLTPEVLLCIEGQVNFQWEGNAKGLEVHKGESVFVPAEVNRYAIHGQATLYRAGVNAKRIGI
ncbi:MAG: mannose-6-phosphate isomerase, class I [Desulfobacteraceae bacterium]|nr:mannose-6-phosphate isomerase, class I [Desulfobacteraceae bacterium]